MDKNKELKVLIIVPIYNESENIDFLIDDLKNTDYDKVFIDDASTDNSLNMLKKHNANIVSLPINLGIGGCIQTGYVYAKENGYDIAIQYDGDGQHIAKYASKLVSAIENGYDYAIGSRYIKSTKETQGFQSTKLRRVGIKILSFLIRLLSGKKIYDVTSGFRACNRTLIDYFCDYYPTDYPEPEVAGAIAKQGYKICEIPVLMRDRNAGTSSIKPLKSIYYMIKVSLAILVLSHSYKRTTK